VTVRRPRANWINRFRRHDGGGTAVEFAMVGGVFITLLLALVQFALFFVSALQVRSAVAETVAYASVFSNTELCPDSRDQAKVREAICKDLSLVLNCTESLKIEQMPLESLPTGTQAIAGTQFVVGLPGDVLVRRAEVGIVTFVPGMSSLTVRTSSIFLQR
jgi:Flp pilus assembly protein TadG